MKVFSLTAAACCFAALFVFCGRKQVPNGDGPGEPDPLVDATVSIAVNRDTHFQTIDGFGFFGAKTVWWDGNPAKLYDRAWAEQVINDLGLTIWRNEYYPPATPSQSQDADWSKQLPVVKGLAEVAEEAGVPLKFIFTVWSPPADLKCAVDNNNQPLSGTPHPDGTKEGGTLDPAKYNDFGNWLADGLQLYKDEGIDVYAFSPQNEPLFRQFFNSCVYAADPWYTRMLENVIPVVKTRFPDVRVFGSENMLEMEGGKDRQWFYNTAIKNNPQAAANLDIWAVHGYSEGITPTASRRLEELWTTMHTEFVEPSAKPVWMTETSGYTDSWLAGGDKPGALDLAADIQAALVHGRVSAWVWWQGSNDAIDEFALMAGTTKGKKYYASKHFYRFIRPGARMVGVQAEGNEEVLVSAFDHPGSSAFTMVLINPGSKNLKVSLSGANLPGEFDYYLTTGAGDNCARKATPAKADSIILPPASIVTLVSGNVF